MNTKSKGYRLLNKEEWLRCARTQHITQEYKDYLDTWTSKDATNHTPMTIGQKKPNALGFYDLFGNVWEWVWDERYVQNAYARFKMGGGYQSDPSRCGLVESYIWPDYRARDVGFRICRDL